MMDRQSFYREGCCQYAPPINLKSTALAQTWYDAWPDAHAEILPAELARMRTLDSFRDRLEAALPRVRVAGPLGTPLGSAS